MPGAAKATRADCLPFLLQGDHLPMVLVDQGVKKVLCFAQLANQACAQHGITELNLADHELGAKTSAAPRQ